MYMSVKAMPSLTSVMSPPHRLCSLSARTVVHPWCFSFLCDFCFVYCDDVRLGAMYEVFEFLDLVSDTVYADLKYDDVFVPLPIAACEWCISSQVCIVAVLSVCISDEPSVCCGCGGIARFTCVLFELPCNLQFELVMHIVEVSYLTNILIK